MSENSEEKSENPEIGENKPSTVDPVEKKLQELKVPADIIQKIREELGVESPEDLGVLTEEDLKGIGMKPVPARRLAQEFTSGTSQAASAAAPTAATGAVSAVSLDSVLPPVPSDASWLEALRTGGVLKVDQSTVISAIRAALASRAGLYDIPAKLVEMMEAFADGTEEQVSPEYFSLRRQMSRRSYAEIFEAIEGLDGTYVTEARKKKLLQRIDQFLWPAIISFNSQLKIWQEAWMQGANPAMMISAIVSATSGIGAMPPGMMQPPDTGVLRDHADAVSDAVNKVFAGTGVQITAALAYDATKIRETLGNPRLPAMIGAANREQMLRQMGVAVSATYPRMEQNVTRFVLAIMQVKDQPSGNEELQYFGALFMLGSQIPWDQLGSDNLPRDGRITGIGATRSGGKL